jgi:hypothetical protein
MGCPVGFEQEFVSDKLRNTDPDGGEQHRQYGFPEMYHLMLLNLIPDKMLRPAEDIK